MRTVRDLFDQFKGPAAVGRVIGKTTEHANSMRTRGSVPIAYWPALITAAQKQGIALDEATLVRIHLVPAKTDASSDQAASHAA